MLSAEPLRPQTDLFDLETPGQRQKYDLGLVRHLCQCRRTTRLRPRQRGERGFAQIVGDDLTTVLECHVPAHGAAHDSQAYEADHGDFFVRHSIAPFSPSTCRR